jgi:hypothetical protein
MGLTCAYQLSGSEIKAREAATEVMRIKPTFSMVLLKKRTSRIKNKEFRDRMLEAYRKAGIPERSSKKYQINNIMLFFSGFGFQDYAIYL